MKASNHAHNTPEKRTSHTCYVVLLLSLLTIAKHKHTHSLLGLSRSLSLSP